MRSLPGDSSVRPTLLLVFLALSSCNAIFGIRGGELTGGGTTTTTTGTGATGAGGTSTGTGASAGTTGGTGGTGGTPGPCEGFPAVDGQATKWVAHPAGVYSDEGQAIRTLPSGDVVMSGWYFSEDFAIDLEPLPWDPTDPGDRENVFVARYDAAGKPAWGVGFSGSDTQSVTAMETDSAGDIVVAGYMLGDMTVGVTTLTSDVQYTTNAMDGFLFKLDGQTGAPKWAKQVGGASTDMITSVAIDSQKNIVIVGASLNGGGEFMLAPQSLPVDYGCGAKMIDKDIQRVFMTKLDPNGACIWEKDYVIDTRFSGLYGHPYGLTLAIDAQDNIVLAGGFAGIANFGGGDAIVASGDKDIFLYKADSNGDGQWAASFGDGNFQVARVVATDADGDIWIGGNYQHSVTLDADHKAVDPDSDPNYWKAYVAKFELDAAPQMPPKPVFIHSYADAGFQYVHAVATTPEGDAVFAGLLMPADGSDGIDYGDGVKIPPPEKDGIGAYHEDGFIAKYCKNGGLRWVKQLSTPASEEVFDVTVDGDGNTYVAGSFSGTYDFDGPKQYTPAGWDPFALHIGP